MADEELALIHTIYWRSLRGAARICLCLAVVAFAQQSSQQIPTPLQVQSTAATPQALLHPNPPDPAYKPPINQTLTYTVDWRFFTAGTATLRMENAHGEHRFLGSADSIGFAAVLYHVKDRFEAFVDPKTNCTLSLTKHTEEGFRRLETVITYEQARRKSVLAEKNLKNSTAKTQENDTPGCVTDVLSGVYYIASQPLAPNTSLVFPLNDGGKTVSVKVNVQAREDIKVPAGTFKTIRVEPTAESGVVKNRGEMWIWFTDDARHIPVQVKARMFFGTLTMKLQNPL